MGILIHRTEGDIPMAAAAKTKVVTAFTDKAGKQWRVGEDYTGSAEDKKAAIAAGQVQEQPADPNQ
jgi:hypothetical protein